MAHPQLIHVALRNLVGGEIVLARLLKQTKLSESKLLDLYIITLKQIEESKFIRIFPKSIKIKIVVLKMTFL